MIRGIKLLYLLPYALMALVVCGIAECCGRTVADAVSWRMLGL
jgi:hypothetical protein